MKRTNSIVIKIVPGLALACICFSACVRSKEFRSQANNGNNVEPENRPLRLGQFRQIHGTRYLKADITEYMSREASSLSSSGVGKMRNLVFVDGDPLDSHRLFETDENVILAVTEYPNHQEDSDVGSKTDDTVTRWLVYQVLKSDTNHDGRIDGSDQETIGVTDASGSGYAEVLSGIDDNFGMSMLNAGQVVIVCSRSRVKSAVLIDLGNRKVVSTKVLADLGPDVK